jgi:DNA-binding SARP family transcriptional activator
VPPEAVDAVRFERLVAQADGQPPAVAEPRLAEALALWRGPALGDVAAEAFARPAAARLESARPAAIEARIDAALALGRHAALVPELEELVGNHPLRERFTAQLMTALARSGRQADALRAFARTRSVLLDELGIDPSAELGIPVPPTGPA